MNRWKMHKLGFLNFWLYDREEFPIEDGHILLRGDNASGKSITTQSFIPFLLDGNRSPERLDPFGSRDRKMEYYLLGDDGREESTGYLYLEFKKAELDEYLTIGVGMRAQKGKGIDFWGFCLCDGRRVGSQGVALWERMGSHLLPLSKQKLRNLLGDGDNWAESPGDYKQLVNDRVFQFRDLRHYEQLIQLLIKVRMPKLTKEAFRPSEVKKVLNESLQTLTDEDLSAMVSTMERMDALEETLRDYRAALKDANIIRNEYTRYNQFMLSKKAEAYLQARTKTTQTQNRLRDQENDLTRMEEERRRQEELRDTAQALLAQARAQRAAMGEDDLAVQHARLEEEREQLSAHEAQLTQGEELLQRLEAEVARREAKLREDNRERDEVHWALQNGLRALEKDNTRLALGEEHHAYLRAVTAQGTRAAEQEGVRAALSARKKQISLVLPCLERLQRAEAAYDDACQAMDRADAVQREQKALLRDAQIKELQERDRLSESLARRRNLNTELLFTAEEGQFLAQAIARYRTPADWSPIRDCMDACLQQRQGQLQTERIRAEEYLCRLEQEAGELRRELERVRSQPEPIPPRRSQIQATRTQLLMRGVPHIPFYEAVDFAPELHQAQCDLLEAQLADAGLLDALVVPETHWEEIRELLQEFPDRFLLPGTPAGDPLTGLVPAGDSRFHAVVRGCLAGISGSDPHGETALLPDGRFRCGMVCGHSRAEAPAGFVGAAARRDNRRRQLEALEERAAEVGRKMLTQQERGQALCKRLQVLQEERVEMPTAADLDQVLEQARQASRAVQDSEAEFEKRRGEELAAKQAVHRLKQEISDASRDLPYERTLSGYEEAMDAAEQYHDRLGLLGEAQNRLSSLLRIMVEAEDVLRVRQEEMAEQNKTNRQRRGILEVSQARVREIQAFLDRPENQAHSRRLAELEREITLRQEEGHAADKVFSELGVKLQTAQEFVRQHREELLVATMDEQDAGNYFSEDLALGLSGLQPGLALEEYARLAAGKIPAADRERTQGQLEETLRNNFQQHNNKLLKYHSKIELRFDAPSKPQMLRQRLCITFQAEGREISLFELIQKLQMDISLTEATLEEKDRELFENILTETISHKLRRRIEDSRQWTKTMTALMGDLDTSMGLTFSLDWRPRRAEDDRELDTALLVELLNKDRALLTLEDSQRVSAHFRAKVKKARQEAAVQDISVNYADLIRAVLDFRTWYEFRLYSLRKGEQKKELTDRAFNKFSGGEKAMAMYLPLFAAVSAQYQKAGTQCPKLLALDEAFAGVDDKNIGAMFELAHTLDFDYIMNSQVLWGCYSCVKSLNIVQFHRPANADVVTVLQYHWNGLEKVLAEEEA